MKLTIAILSTLVLTSTVVAFECPFGAEGHLLPVRWSATAGDSSTDVRIGIQSTFDRPIKMVDAGAWFVDGLGRQLSERGMAIDPDLKIEASGANISAMTYVGVDRLLGAAFEDFTVHICTRAVLFDDGTKAEF